MKFDRHHMIIRNLDKWRREKPLWLIWGGLAVVMIVYYLGVISTFNEALLNVQSGISGDKTNIEWMVRASREITRLRQVAPREKTKSSNSAFAIVNKAINDQGWNDIVNDVHQIDENSTQVNFKSVSFNDLIAWLQKLYADSGVYVKDAKLDKIRAGMISASLVLQNDSK